MHKIDSNTIETLRTALQCYETNLNFSYEYVEDNCEGSISSGAIDFRRELDNIATLRERLYTLEWENV